MPINFLVVAHDFCHELHPNEVAAVAAAFQAADEGLLCRVFLLVREIDLNEWERCPDCGKAVEKGIGCWSEECYEARMKTPCD